MSDLLWTALLIVIIIIGLFLHYVVIRPKPCVIMDIGLRPPGLSTPPPPRPVAEQIAKLKKEKAALLYYVGLMKTIACRPGCTNTMAGKMETYMKTIPDNKVTEYAYTLRSLGIR